MLTSQASSPNTTMSRVSLGYLTMTNSANAMATFLAGVMRSSPYKIMLWLMSIISTVAVVLLCSRSSTTRSSSVSLNPPRPLAAPGP